MTSTLACHRLSDSIMDTLNLSIRPESFRLPTRGVDPFFGLSRAYYYELDTTGQVLLVRLRKRGSQQGVTLINYSAMSAFLAKAARQSGDGSVSELAPERLRPWHLSPYCPECNPSEHI